MRNKCIKCSEETIGLICSKCDWKDERNGIIFVCVVVLSVLAMTIGIKYAWAVYAYDDWRCMFSECRIIK
jgi:hypothetical protein